MGAVRNLWTSPHTGDLKLDLSGHGRAMQGPGLRQAMVRRLAEAQALCRVDPPPTRALLSPVQASCLRLMRNPTVGWVQGGLGWAAGRRLFLWSAMLCTHATRTTRPKLEAVRCTLDNRVLGTAVSESIWATISIRAISMSTHDVLKTQGHVLRRPFEVIRETPSQDAARGNTQNCMSARDVSDTQNSYRPELVVLKTRWEVSACGAPLPDGQTGPHSRWDIN